MPRLPAWIFLSSALDNGLISVSEFCGGMAEAAGSEEPVVEQPAAVNQDQQTGQAVEEGKVLGLVSLLVQVIHCSGRSCCFKWMGLLGYGRVDQPAFTASPTWTGAQQCCQSSCAGEALKVLLPILENAHSFRGQKLLQANLWRLGNVLVNFNNLFCCDSVLLLGLDFLLCSLATEALLWGKNCTCKS